MGMRLVVSSPISKQEPAPICRDIAFPPWVGERYSTSGYFGLRVLILAERYLGSPPAPDGLPKAGPYRYSKPMLARRFWRNVASMFLGDTSPNDVRQFWHEVACGTYLQTIPPRGRDARNRALWEASRKPFRSLMEGLRPECVFALGYGLYSHLAPSAEPARLSELLVYDLPVGRAAIARLKNPLAPAFACAEEASRIRRAITAVKLSVLG